MPDKTDKIEDELDAALAMLDAGPLPTTTLPASTPPPEQVAGEALPAAAPIMESVKPTLDALDETRRKKINTICEHCPNSVWFKSEAEVKCYCRVMYVIMWSNKEPNQLTNCDGIFIGQDQE